MPKIVALLALTALFPDAARAQPSRAAMPLRLELGLYAPAFSQTRDSPSYDVALGYALHASHGLELGVEARGSILGLQDDDPSNDVPFSDDGNYRVDNAVVNLGLNARYRPRRKGVFLGAGLGAARADIHRRDLDPGHVTKLGYALEAGYDFNRKVYGVVRYQGTTDDLPVFRGVAFDVGFRFR